MGSFAGHAIPGIFFSLLGAWWTVCIYTMYFRSLKKGAKPFKSHASYYPAVIGSKLDVEAIVLLVQGVLGMLVVLVITTILNGIPPGPTNIQHATMYFFYTLFALVSLLKPVLGKLFSSNFADDITYLTLVIVFSIEAILFKFHLMGRDNMDITVHTLLLYSVYGCAVMALVELVFRHQVLVSLGRAYFTMLQGTWFCQASAILYDVKVLSWAPPNPAWDHEDHEHIKYATCIFTWYMGGVFLFSLLCGVGLAFVHKRRGELCEFEDEKEQLMNSDAESDPGV